jgi:hypothetical protein
MLVTVLTLAGLAGILSIWLLLRASKSKAEREARRRAALIRQRLAEPPQVIHHKVEIRLKRSAGR